MNPEYEVLRTELVEICENMQDYAERNKEKLGADQYLGRTVVIARIRAVVDTVDGRMATRTPVDNSNAAEQITRQASVIKQYQEALIAHHAVCPIASSVSLVNVLANEVKALMGEPELGELKDDEW